MSLRLAIDARPLADPGGEAYPYTLHLVHALAFVDPDSEFHLLLDREPPPSVVPTAPNVQVTILRAPARLWKLSALAPAVEKLRVDLLHVQGLLPARSEVPVVTTIRHLGPVIQPRQYPGGTGFAWRRMLPRQLAEAAAVLTPWQATARTLLGAGWLTPDRLTVTPYGVEPLFRPQCESVIAYARERLALPARYVLGRCDPGRGPGPLVDLWRRARDEHGLDAELVLDRTDGLTEPFPSVAGTELAAWPAILSGAVATICGGRDEAAALALLESLACGVPAVGPAAEFLEEVAGPTATLGEPACQAAALARLASDPEERTRRLRGGLARAHQRTWPGLAEQTLAVYRRVLGA